jgi:exopolysaccharide production protein ExoQ
VTPHKNELGILCIFSVFFLLWSFIKRWKEKNKTGWKYQNHLEIFVLIIAIRLMGGPEGNIFYSATAFYSLTAGLFAFLGILLLKKYKIILSSILMQIVVGMIILVGIISLYSSGSTIGFFATSAGRNETLTGRTELWASLLPLVAQRPLLGHGVGSSWTPQMRQYYNMSDGHSGYMEVLLELGFVGITLLSMFLFSLCRKAHRELCDNFEWGNLFFCYIIMLVVQNVTESAIESFSGLLPAVVLLYFDGASTGRKPNPHLT